MIKYIGSKRTLVPKIVSIVRSIPDVETAIDLFSGTSRVGHALKSTGIYVSSNDHNAYAHALAKCYVEADAETALPVVQRLIRELSMVRPAPGYFTETFCEQSRYFHPKNGAKIDAIRERIASWDLEEQINAILLTSLMEAADRVDSTTGVQMAYLKRWAPRALNDLELRVPAILSGPGRAMRLDALEAAHQLRADLAYLDPPYNQHSYLGNYHIWESLVLWDKPEVYGVACKRVQCKEYKSAFNSKPKIKEALVNVIKAVQARHLLVSFNNEGHIGRTEMESILGQSGYVTVIETDFKRYVGAQIGIYNPSGDKVGAVSHLRNKEYLYVVSKDASVGERVRESVGLGGTQPSLF